VGTHGHEGNLGVFLCDGRSFLHGCMNSRRSKESGLDERGGVFILWLVAIANCISTFRIISERASKLSRGKMMRSREMYSENTNAHNEDTFIA